MNRKNNLFKPILVCFIVYVILSWIIPGSSVSEGAIAAGTRTPTGLFGMFYYPVVSIATFIQFSVAILAIGGLYGVMSKTGVYETLTEQIAKKFEGKEKVFLIAYIAVSAVVTSVLGLTFPLFVFVPLFVGILLKLGYNKKTAVASAIGSMMVGNIASTFGLDYATQVIQLLGLKVGDSILPKSIMLIVLVVLFVLFVCGNKETKVEKGLLKKLTKKSDTMAEPKVSKSTGVKKVSSKATTKKAASTSKTTKTASKSTKTTTKKATSTKAAATKATTKTAAKAVKEKVEEKVKEVVDDVIAIPEKISIPFAEEEVKSGKHTLPLIVALILLGIIILLGLTNWNYMFGVEAFTKFHETISGITIGKNSFPIVANLLNIPNALGNWTSYEFAAVLAIFSFVIGWLYNINVKDITKAFAEGAKKAFPTAMLVGLACVVFTMMLVNSSNNIFLTIIGWITSISKSFNPIVVGLSGLVSGFFYNDFYYGFNEVSSLFTTLYDESFTSITGVIYQAFYGLGAMILPTSFLLVTGLSLFDVSYKEWMKYIWKFLIQVFVVLIIISAILTLMV